MSLSLNKKATHDYKISETFEAGLVLSGAEVKSAKKGQIDLKGAYISLDDNMEAWLVNAYIAPYKPAKATQKNYNPHQNRKLLLNKKELQRIFGKQKEKGVSILPLKVFIKNHLIKIEIGIGTGKKKYDKREDIKKRDFDRRKQRMTR
jgi:SsrA-binding protein